MKILKNYHNFRINESSTEEAWELVGQNHPVINSALVNAGFSFDYVSVSKLTHIIDNLDLYLANYHHIKNFDNLENKDSDIGLLQKCKEISTLPNSRFLYKKLMQKRDLLDVDENGYPRKRGYNVVLNFDRILSGDYEPPLIFLNDDKYYVVGGRTRLYASVATNLPIKVKVLTTKDLAFWKS